MAYLEPQSRVQGTLLISRRGYHSLQLLQQLLATRHRLVMGLPLQALLALLHRTVPRTALFQVLLMTISLLVLVQEVSQICSEHLDVY